MKITIVGTGYVGLVTGTCFSEMGHEVICVDIDEAKIAALKQGIIPIYEPGLSEMVRRNVAEGRLSFTTDLKASVEKSLFIFIAVGTPPRSDGTADLSYVVSVASTIGAHMNGYKIIVDKSTVPVGTAEEVRKTIQEKLAARNASYTFDVVSNPEFLREGAAIDDFMHPDRIVLGCDDVRTGVLAKELYASFARDGRPILVMSTKSAEMTKYAANAMLAAKISFINEIANICERVGADITEVRNGIASDKRIGYHFISPGIGYGGSCFPKDVKALMTTSREIGYEAQLLESIDGVNENQKLSLVEKITTYYKGNIAGKRFAMWGLSFKPDTDDVREAPSLYIAEALLNGGATICAYDPKAMHEAQRILGHRENFHYAESSYAALEGCDALLLVTEWSAFHNPDFERMKTLLCSPIVFDGRNIYSPELMAMFGYDYISVGRKSIFAHSNG